MVRNPSACPVTRNLTSEYRPKDRGGWSQFGSERGQMGGSSCRTDTVRKSGPGLGEAYYPSRIDIAERRAEYHGRFSFAESSSYEVFRDRHISLEC